MSLQYRYEGRLVTAGWRMRDVVIVSSNDSMRVLSSALVLRVASRS
jgi:hypothetical protein